MSKVLKSLQLVTQSYSGTPSTGTGALFASGSTMYFENSNGTLFPLGLSEIGGYIIVKEYTGSNPGDGTLTYDWYKPDNLRFVQVICVGAGGGGGGGSVRSSAISNIGGGAGGGGGAIAWGFFDASMLTQPSYSISVGKGGTGGARPATVGSGGTGGTGEYTTFGGNMVSASGGSGGEGGDLGTPFVASPGIGGLAINCLPGPGFAINGGSAGANSPGSLPDPVSTFFLSPLTQISTAAGGGGGNIRTNISFFSGSVGASGVEYNTLKSNNTTNANSGSNNLVTAAVLVQFTSSVPITTNYGLGGGGNGAPQYVFNNIYAGGNGGLYGAGGGGGSGYFGTGPVANQGGSGSSGLCIVVEYY